MRKTISILFVLALVLSFSLVATTPVAAAERHVPGTYATIQAAIDDADPGDTIIVAAGHIAEENLIITTDGLTLTTDASDPATIMYQAATTSSVVDIRGEGVILENFIIERNNGGSGSQAINVRRSNVVVRGTTITGSDNNHGPHAIPGIMLTDGDPGPYGMDIGGILLKNNHLSGDFAYGVYVTTLASGSIEVSIEGNTLEGLTYDGSYWGWGTRPGWGVGIWDSSFVAFGGSLTVDIAGNNFDGHGIYMLPKDVATPVLDVTVNCNNFVGSGNWGVYNPTDVIVDATFNWWGDASGPSPHGTGNAVSANVDVDPWLQAALTEPVSVQTETATGQASFTPSHGGVASLTAVTPPAGAPAGVTFPHGMFELQICCLTPGQTVTLTVTLPSAVPVGTVWWKHDNGRWYSLPNRNDNGDNIMVIRLRDGGTGDTDGVADGIITDPGGPGNPLTVGWEGSPVSKAGVLAPWIALLAAMMAGASLLVSRRRMAQI